MRKHDQDGFLPEKELLYLQDPETGRKSFAPGKINFVGEGVPLKGLTGVLGLAFKPDDPEQLNGRVVEAILSSREKGELRLKDVEVSASLWLQYPHTRPIVDINTFGKLNED